MERNLFLEKEKGYMKLVREALVLRRSHEVENPVVFFFLAYLSIVLAAFGAGILLSILSHSLASMNLTAIAIGLGLFAVSMALAAACHLKAKRFLKE